MNVVVVSAPASGHLNPMLPLVDALVAQGDRVVLATGADMSEVAGAHGALFHEAGSGIGTWFERLGARIRGAPGDGLPPERINYYFLPRLFAEIGADDMVDGVVAACRGHHADVVLFEPYAFAAPLAAAITGVPAVNHQISPPLELDILALGADAVSPLWRALGLDGAPPYAGLYDGTTIAICPPVLDPRDIPGDTMALRPCPLPVRHETTRRLVYVTMGTVLNSAVDVFRAVVDALEAEPVEVVVTVGADQDPAGIGPVPANTRVERFVPQAALLPDCAVVVHHGGSGTMLGALAHGVPQLVVPQGADNFINAALLRDAGAGTFLGPGEVHPDAVRAAVRALIAEPGYRQAAERCAREIAAMPGADEVAGALRARYDAGAGGGVAPA